MRIVLFYHSLLSDWNHGNAHFLRGIVTELRARGHEAVVYEPQNAWSLQNLLAEQGQAALDSFHCAYPGLSSVSYDPATLNLDAALNGADLVLVHEWNDHEFARRVGQHRARNGKYRLLFHDTHHRAITDPNSMAAYDLTHYDGVLAFGAVLRDLYLARHWAQRAWTWHEAADTRVFYPMPEQEREGDFVWIGNWGDGERTAELREFLLEPVKALKLKAKVYGVRYPLEAKDALAQAGIEYGGWLSNCEAPRVFAQYALTAHIPRRPYVRALPGIPTIRVFEALACGIPLISAPWEDSENLFTPGEDFLTVQNGDEMRAAMELLLADRERAAALAARGRQTILARHTCAHRVTELLAICAELGIAPQSKEPELLEAGA